MQSLSPTTQSSPIMLKIHDTPNHLSTDKYNELCSAMRAKNLQMLGAGVFGSAWALPNGNVLKIGRGSGRLDDSMSDILQRVDGYADWVMSVCAAVKSGNVSEFFPRIVSADIFMAAEHRCYYVVQLEKLNSLANANHETRVSAVRKIDRTIKDGFGIANLISNGHRFSTESGRVLAATLGPVLRRRGVDLHFGNIMVRKDSFGAIVPVITDPAV